VDGRLREWWSYQSKITAEAVAEYLNVKVRNLPTFEHLVMEGGRL